MSESRRNSDLNALIEALRARHQPEETGIVSAKNINVLVLGVIGAAGALVWSVVTSAPESFGVIQQQTTEIRTTVLEMRGTLTGINERLENNARQTSEQQAKIAGLEQAARSNTEGLKRLEDRLTEVERTRGR